jgi:hypothetical protein
MCAMYTIGIWSLQVRLHIINTNIINFPAKRRGWAQ